MEVRLYARMLQRGWWIIALTVLAALNISLVVSYTATPLYQTAAQFLVSPSSEVEADAGTTVYSLDTLDGRSIVTTYAEVTQSLRAFRETAVALGIDPGPPSDYTASAMVLPESNVVQLTVVGPDPQLVSQLANGMGQRAIDYVNSVYHVFVMTFLNDAPVPTKPISPRPLVSAGIAIVLGLAIGAGLAILREQLRLPLSALLQRGNIDTVSTALSKRFFRQKLEETARTHPEALALGLVQLDGLPDLLETLPRSLIQYVLRHTTSTFRDELRGSDLVGRWDDTRFSVMLPATPGPAAVRVMERIRESIAEPIVLDRDETVSLLPRIGVAVYQEDESIESLVEHAETALEKAEVTGDGTVLYGDDTTSSQG